jgi:hypothetical protein
VPVYSYLALPGVPSPALSIKTRATLLSFVKTATAFADYILARIAFDTSLQMDLFQIEFPVPATESRRQLQKYYQPGTWRVS